MTILCATFASVCIVSSSDFSSRNRQDIDCKDSSDDEQQQQPQNFLSKEGPLLFLMSDQKISLARTPYIKTINLIDIFSLDEIIPRATQETDLIRLNSKTTDYANIAGINNRNKRGTEVNEKEYGIANIAFKQKPQQQIASESKTMNTGSLADELSSKKRSIVSNVLLASRAKEVGGSDGSSDDIGNIGRSSFEEKNIMANHDQENGKKQQQFRSKRSNSLSDSLGSQWHTAATASQVTSEEALMRTRNVTSATAERRTSDSNLSQRKEQQLRLVDMDVHIGLGLVFAVDSRGTIITFSLGFLESNSDENDNQSGNDYDASSNSTISDDNGNVYNATSANNNAHLRPVDEQNKNYALFGSHPTSGLSKDKLNSDELQGGTDERAKLPLNKANQTEWKAHASYSGPDSLLQLGEIENSLNHVRVARETKATIASDEYSAHRQQERNSGVNSSKRNLPIVNSVDTTTNSKQQVFYFESSDIKFSRSDVKIIWSRSTPNAPKILSSEQQVGDNNLTAGGSSYSTSKFAIDSLQLSLVAYKSHQNANSSFNSNQVLQNQTPFDESVGRTELCENNDKANASCNTTKSDIEGDATGINDVDADVNADGLNNIRDDNESRLRLLNSKYCSESQIAVDWLNNVLFVLDKLRLFVVDFDGNNEHLLINDFTPDTRPVNLRVDPVNGYLFWTQLGEFHNTVYRLDIAELLNLSIDKLLSSSTAESRIYKLAKLENDADVNNETEGRSTLDNKIKEADVELVPLLSRHNAHPIVTNLPKQTKLFALNYRLSKIYIPNAKSPLDSGRLNKLEIETHNLTISSSEKYDNSHETISNDAQIFAYNLDGTDEGPMRTKNLIYDERYLANLNSVQDLSIDASDNLLYWLSDGGKMLVEEVYEKEIKLINGIEHTGPKFNKLINIDANLYNQPFKMQARLNLTKLTQAFTTLALPSRLIRSKQHQHQHLQLFNGEQNESLILSLGTTRSQYGNAPFMIVAGCALALFCIYFAYTLVASNRRSDSISAYDSRYHASSRSECQDDNRSQDSSHDSNSIVGSTVDDAMSSQRPDITISDISSHGPANHRWASDYNSASRSADNLQNINTTGATAIKTFANSDYDNTMQNNSTIEKRECLVNLAGWPINMNDVSNRLYVPVEISQDAELAKIHRVANDQLKIARDPIGKGHFGTVYLGLFTCNSDEKEKLEMKFNDQRRSIVSLANSENYPTSSIFALSDHQDNQTRQSQPPLSSTSSGHGSNSVFSDFATASTNIDPGSSQSGEYLTPNTHFSNYRLADANECIAQTSSPVSSSFNSYFNLRCRNDQRDNIFIAFEENEDNGTVNYNCKVAIKKLKDSASTDEMKDFLQEAKLLSNFSHPNIVHLLGICFDRGSTLIVMELMEGGDLRNYMRDNSPKPSNLNPLNMDDLLSICIDIANGCCYLEKLNYIHRDLAARNCLVSNSDKIQRVVKLADFGLARDVYKKNYYKKLNNDSCMPLRWMAPECLSEQKFTTKSDVWSFGIVLWEVMNYCLSDPYDKVPHYMMSEHLRAGNRLEKPQYCPNEVYALMKECWKLDVKERPTFHDCKSSLVYIRDKLGKNSFYI